MKFRTEVEIAAPEWRIEAWHKLLCIGSCFAQRIGERMSDSGLMATVNPWGTLYNPASIAEALQVNMSKNTGTEDDAPIIPDILIITLGTPHVYMRDGKVVSNCQKLPARLFTECDLSQEEIVTYLLKAVEQLHKCNPDIKIIFTVSPYRYAKYGMHGSQLGKAKLLLSVDELIRRLPYATYFPAYEIVLDELRDYRFFDTDMFHPSQQAVEYIWERFIGTMLSPTCQAFIAEMAPIRKAFAHHPFDPTNPDYQRFIAETRAKEKLIIAKYMK